jgi:hypothetical protein
MIKKEKKAEIRQGDLLEYVDGDVVLVTDPEGMDEETCTGVLIKKRAGYCKIGDYRDDWLKYKCGDGSAVKKLKGKITIEFD